MEESPVKNKYTYNGKEFQEDLGINLHYYGFRVYDPAIGRFTSVDPIAEEFAFVSGFNYAENEPVASIDLHGLQRVNVIRDVISGDPAMSEGKATQADREELSKNMEAMSGAFAAGFMAFLPGPEDLVLGGAALKWIGGLFKSGKKAKSVASKADDLGNIGKQTKDQLESSKESLEGLITEHQKKMDDFMKDPVGNTSPEKLKQMTADNPSPETLLERASQRGKALQKQITKQKGELDKVNQALKEID